MGEPCPGVPSLGGKSESSRQNPIEGTLVAQYNHFMDTVKFKYWEDQGKWIGYLETFPDYHTQGESLEDLKDHLRDLYKDLQSGEIPGVRRIAELQLL
jgi:hypothetical protein